MWSSSSSCGSVIRRPDRRTAPEVAQKAGDSTDSPYTENQALSSVLGNYSVCLQNAQQLVSLQSWILKTKESVDKQNAERGLGVKLPDMPWSKK